MTRPSEYTPVRRRLLQVVMGIILLGTIGLAAMVGSVNRRAGRVELSPGGISSGDVNVRLPVGWRALPNTDEPRAVVQAEELIGSRDGGRRLAVMFESLEVPASPVQHLIERFRLPITSLAEDQDPIVRIEAAKVAGHVGVLVSIDSLLMGEGTPQLPHKEVFAAAVLPSRRAVVVHLRGFGQLDLTDRAVARQVAGAIGVQNEPALAPQGSGAVTLPGGTHFAPPVGFSVVEARDPLRTDRLLWPAIAEGASAGQREAAWTTLETVECLLPPPGDAKAAEATLRRLLLVRDHAWHGATITAAGPDSWRAEISGSIGEGSSFRGVAMLRSGPGGRALLAIFRGGFGAGVGFDAAWNELAESLRFGPPPPFQAMESAGAAIASRLREMGYDRAISDRTEQWWLWTDASERPHVAWSHLEFDAAGSAAGEVRARSESRLRREGGAVTRLSDQFRYADAAATYESDLTRSDAQGADPPRSIRQVTTLRDGQLTIALSTPSRSIGQWKSPAPAAFIPGALLPLVMDQFLSINQPVLVRSESFPGFEGTGAPDPLAILLRPFKNETRKAEGEDAPMRCIEAEVVGSGVISRWYFRKSGVVECIDLPAGVQRTGSDSNAIRFAFDQDTRMSPP
jgi:hypothetical protein